MIGSLMGGIGLFLLGMTLLTDGLKAAAGDALRRWLQQLTGGAGKAMLSGTLITMLIQSSSATVLATIGFVSAGLLTFTQAVGLIIGANLGTTSTGWIVSLLGLKISVSSVALPLVGIGALVRFLAKGRIASLGLALAGFAVIFVGIDLLQTGMASLGSAIDPSRFPGATLAGRVALVAVGAAMTVVLQSSSAATATTLTALHAGTVDISQAAMLVIGQSVGTSFTAVLAAVGASVPARRTAVAHIVFNSVAAVAAFLMVPGFLRLAAADSIIPGESNPAVAMAAFHTGFKLAGVALFLPLASRFAALIAWMIPERGSTLVRNLDPSVAEVPAVGVEAARRTVQRIAAASIGAAGEILRRAGGSTPPPVLVSVAAALADTRGFLSHVRTSPSMVQEHGRHLAVLHALDHLDRLSEALTEAPEGRMLTGNGADGLKASTVETLEGVTAWLEEKGASPEEQVRALSLEIAAHRRSQRPLILARAAAGGIPPDEVLERLDALRWLDRVVYHVWRCVHHLAAPGEEAPDVQAEAFAEAGTS